MLLAYRRGVLEPYYDLGLQSLARERMLLTALDNEAAADRLEQATQAEAIIMANYLKRDAIGEYIDIVKDKIQTISNIKLYDPYPTRNSLSERRAREAEQMVEAYIKFKEEMKKNEESK